MHKKSVTVGVLGTGEWTQKAHLPAFKSCREARLVAICGRNSSRTKDVAQRFGIPETYTDHHELLERTDIDMVVVSTSSSRHFELALDAIRAGKAVLCEKPLAPDYKKALLLSQEAEARKIKTKVAFIFRYSPLIRRMKELITEGFIGEPFHFNGFIQNPNYIDATAPFPLTPTTDSIAPGSIQEYSPHLIDLALWLNGDLIAVVGLMKNFIPKRTIRDYGKMMRANFDDGCVWLAEFENGAQATFQTSFVALGPRPGLEIRIFGSQGALIGRLAEDYSNTENEGTLIGLRRGGPHFAPLKIPKHLQHPHDSESEKHTLCMSGPSRLRCLVKSFLHEILTNQEPADNFQAGAKAQEVATAVYLSCLERRWISLPLDRSHHGFE